MVFNWNKFKEILIHRKGLGILGFSDISASVITSVFWFYIASVMQPEEYGEIFYFIAIISIAFTFSSIGTQNSIIVLTATVLFLPLISIARNHSLPQPAK